MQDKLIEILLFVLATVVGLFIFVAVLNWVLPDTVLLGDLANVVLALVTVLAIIFGGLFAAVKFELFRDFEPHLTISHTINHRNIADSYVHLDVKVTLHNSSRVRVELREGFFLLQQITPVTGGADFLGQNFLYPDWPVLVPFPESLTIIKEIR